MLFMDARLEWSGQKEHMLFQECPILREWGGSKVLVCQIPDDIKMELEGMIGIKCGWEKNKTKLSAENPKVKTCWAAQQSPDDPARVMSVLRVHPLGIWPHTA